MKTAQANAWISYHLHYSASPDPLLVDTIWPFVQQLRNEHLVRQFFFIRYGDEQGPHIRLRLLPDKTAHRQEIMRRTKARFPAARFTPYVPETERYGDPAGLPITESLFDASSLAVLRLMAGDASWSYGRALASALQIHLGMLQAFGLSRKETAALCAHLAESAQSKTLPQTSVDQFERNFAAQRQTMVPHLIRLWDACEQSRDFKDLWFAGWREAMTRIGARIRQADKAGKLHLLDNSGHDSPLWYLYESYIHMTNNRLGITRPDELLLAYILHRSLMGSGPHKTLAQGYL